MTPMPARMLEILNCIFLWVSDGVREVGRGWMILRSWDWLERQRVYPNHLGSFIGRKLARTSGLIYSHREKKRKKE